MFLIVQCPKCGKHQVTSSFKSFRCKFCNRASKLVSSKGISRVNVLGKFELGSEAAEFVRGVSDKSKS